MSEPPPAYEQTPEQVEDDGDSGNSNTPAQSVISQTPVPHPPASRDACDAASLSGDATNILFDAEPLMSLHNWYNSGHSSDNRHSRRRQEHLYVTVAFAKLTSRYQLEALGAMIEGMTVRDPQFLSLLRHA